MRSGELTALGKERGSDTYGPPVTTDSPPAAPQIVDLDVLFEAYHRQAIGLAYRMTGNLGDAEEIVQEVFIAAWKSGHTYDASRGSTGTWVLSMVHNRSIDLLRARRRRPIYPLPEGIDPTGPSDVPAEAISNLDAEAARMALNSLPPKQKRAIELAYFAGLSQSEIADQLAAPLGTVKGRIRLGLDRLRVAMGVQPRRPLGPMSSR